MNEFKILSSIEKFGLGKVAGGTSGENLSNLSSMTGVSKKDLKKRNTLGILGIASYFYGALEFFILAILVSLVYTKIPKIPNYDAPEFSSYLKSKRKSFLGFTIFLWIAFVFTIALTIVMFWMMSALTIPYISFIFIVINVIITFVLLVYSLMLLTEVIKAKNKVASSEASSVIGYLVGIILVIVLSVALLLTFGIYSVIKYKPRQDLEIASAFVPEVGVALSAYDSAKAVKKL